MKKSVFAALLASALPALAIVSFIIPAPAVAALPVFDPTNYAQNLLQAARALQQINQQIEQLQHEATMIAQAQKNLEKIDFPQLRALTDAMQKIDRLMGQAQGIGFQVKDLDARFAKSYPGSANTVLSSNQSLRDAKARIDDVMDAFRQSMGVQAQVVENVAADAQSLSAIVAQSQGAQGSLQAQQATNQLLALTAKQQFQLQNMMAAQFRSETAEAARKAQSESDGRAATRKFLGDGKAYTPN